MKKERKFLSSKPSVAEVTRMEMEGGCSNSEVRPFIRTMKGEAGGEETNVRVRWRGPCSMSCLGRFWEMRLCWRRHLSGMSTDFLLMVLPLRGSVWLTLGVLPVVVPSALAGAVVWLAPVTERLAVWLGRCRVRCALCLLPPRVLACARPSPLPRSICLRVV